MLGLGDAIIAAAFYLMLGSTALCVIYGILTWNQGEPRDDELQEARDWAEEEHNLEDIL